MNEEKNVPSLKDIEGKLKEEKESKQRSEELASDLIEGAIELDIDSDLKSHEKNEVEVQLEDAEEEKPKKKRIKVDISNLSVIDDRDTISREQDLKNALYGGKQAFQVVAAQSGYTVKVIPLVHKDTINLLYSNLNRYEYRRAVYKVIYDKCVAFSVGKMTFEEFLKNTSVEDIESLYYGVYCSTFPNEGSFSMTCPECGEERTYKVNHSNLFKTSDRKAMTQLISKVSREATSREKMNEFSLLNKYDAFQLQDSGIVVELRTPSLWDSLELLRLVPESVIDKDQQSVTNMLYIKQLLIPVKGVKGSYSPITDRQEILRIIDNSSIDDASELVDAVAERVDNNRITYSIKNAKCPNCGAEIKEVPISIEDILFNLIFEHAQ